MSLPNALASVTTKYVKKEPPLKPIYYVIHVGTLKPLKSYQLSKTIPEWTDKTLEAQTYPTRAAADSAITESLKLNWKQCKVIETLN